MSADLDRHRGTMYRLRESKPHSSHSLARYRASSTSSFSFTFRSSSGGALRAERCRIDFTTGAKVID